MSGGASADQFDGRDVAERVVDSLEGGELVLAGSEWLVRDQNANCFTLKNWETGEQYKCQVNVLVIRAGGTS